MRAWWCIALASVGCNDSLGINDPHPGTSELSIAISAPPTYAARQLSYRVEVVNDGELPAQQVVVRTMLPPDLVETSVAEPLCSLALDVVTCQLGVLFQGNPSTIHIDAHAPNEGGSFPTTASVTTTSVEQDVANNTATMLTIVKPQADLAIVMTGTPDPAPTGSTITYAIEVSNLGASTAEAVRVEVTSTMLAIASLSGTGWSCSGTMCTLSTPLAVGAAPPLTATAPATLADTSVFVTAKVVATTEDHDDRNNSTTIISHIN
jgi:hypothetical protein